MIGPRYSLFHAHISEGTKRESRIRNSLSHLIADYFQLWNFHQAHTGGLRLCKTILVAVGRRFGCRFRIDRPAGRYRRVALL